MKIHTLPVGLFLGLAWSAAAPLLHASTPNAQVTIDTFPDDEIAGYITVEDANNRYCNIPVPVAGSGVVRVHDFRVDGQPCKDLHDKARSITLENLPSATEILLADSSTCSSSGGPGVVGKFWVKLKTTKKVTTPQTMQMSFFFAHADNTIIAPGVMLVGKYLEGDSTDALDTLSCVRITTSRATLPKPTVPVRLINQYTEWASWDEGISYHCGGNRIMLGRAHFGDEEDDTEYRCGTPMQGDTAIILKNHKTADKDEYDHYFVCPPHTVMTGQELKNDERSDTRYTCAEAWVADTRLYVLPNDFRSSQLDENHHRFACGGDKVVIGRAHEDDENGVTWYQCGTLYEQSPP